MKPRLAAVKILRRVIDEGRSLGTALDEILDKVEPRERPLTQELAYGVLRYYHRLDGLCQLLMDKPLKAKEQEVRYLILLGLYQLLYMKIPPHAAVNETVNITKPLNKPWARGLINALLRRLQREQEDLLARLDTRNSDKYAHPQWLLARLQQAWPEQWQAIVEANNQRPPLVVRVNQQHYSRDQYLQRLQQAGIEAHASPHVESAIILEKPVDVLQLPGFTEGAVSVQDSAAQLAGLLLDAQAGETVLDACAAPGGKTAHILEQSTGIKLDALDVDSARLQRVNENLKRLELEANIIQGDAAQPEDWWSGQPYDRILLDAPCSATGVIRRHPDIKVLRRDSDIAALVKLQGQILEALWPTLKPGGTLLYATCSVLPEENSQQVQGFLQRHKDAREIVIDAPWGQACESGRQIITGSENMDGFYYALIAKGN